MSWFKRKYQQLGNWVCEQLGIEDLTGDGKTNFSDLGKQIGKMLENNAKKFGETDLTDREKAEADLQLQNQRQLNEDEYQRKIDFYEQYESPEARVRQYKEAGLNPMLLAGGGASVSASGGVGSPGSASAPSASAAPAGLGSLIETLIGVKRFALERRDIESQILKRETETSAQRIENKWNERLKAIKEREMEASIAAYGARVRVDDATVAKMAEETKYQKALVMYAPRLMEASIGKDEAAAALSRSKIELNDTQIANLNEVMKNHQKERELIDAKIAECEHHVYMMTTQSELNSALAEQAWHQVSKISSEIDLIAEQINLTRKDVDFYIWNHQRSSTAFGIKWNTSSENGRTTKGEHSINDMVFLLRQAGYTVEEPTK